MAMEPLMPGRTCTKRPLACSPVSSNAIASQSAAGGRKRIFLGLLSASCLALCLLLFLFLILPWLVTGGQWLKYTSLGVGATGIFLILWLCLTLVFHIHTGKRVPGISGMRHLCIRLFLPLMEVAGRLVGMDKTVVRRSFIKVNNEFACSFTHTLEKGKLLLLLPHCIQTSTCMRRLGPDLSNCGGCGKCQIAYLRELAQLHGFKIAIATGGTVARRIVAEMRPSFIVAVACERDLVSGIQDSYPVPVFGVLNERPLGPCRDTCVPLENLNSALAFFLERPKTS